MDPYLWCQSQPGMYIEQDTLREWLENDLERDRTVILDCRDDDNSGGHVTGAIHVPDKTFDGARVAEMLEARGGCRRVVLHCMESARRGPRCAKRLSEALGKKASGGSPGESTMSIHVLKGGADLWIRRFVGQDHLVDGFDNEFWGWPGDGRRGPGICGGDPSADAGWHVNYTRPVDQPATPWNKGGADVADAK